MMPRDVIQLSDEQFKRLEELLLPGYQLATAMLEQLKRQQEAAYAPGPDAAADPSNQPNPAPETDPPAEDPAPNADETEDPAPDA